MSRTYRRKNALWNFYQGIDYGLYYDHIFSLEEIHARAVQLNQKTKDYKKARKIYHSDKAKYRSSVPSWFVNMFRERTFRRKTKHIIYQYTKNPEIEVILPKYVHDAGWHYY